MMVRETPVHLKEQFDRLYVELFQNAVNGGPGGPVTGIEDNFHFAGQR